ncbi:hypothetical protein CANMA_001762 [Candida margitis]|uniref:uncharacterized protein n=1 Tax=Candida margitis TaxID=1775924 RepID=UPI002225E130|nr:uncharacterized protein CANMA_001762 [Candida margitis]KAI5969209.1 hypothetical protein CANMA_001762 [Candida margitis]
MSHDDSHEFFKLQLEEDAYFKQLSYGHIIGQKRTLSVGSNRSKHTLQQEQANDNGKLDNLNYDKEKEKLLQLCVYQEWYKLQSKQMNELRVKIYQDQMLVYNETVKRYRKCEGDWIRSHGENKRQEEEAKRKIMGWRQQMKKWIGHALRKKIVGKKKLKSFRKKDTKEEDDSKEKKKNVNKFGTRRYFKRTRSEPNEIESKVTMHSSKSNHDQQDRGKSKKVKTKQLGYSRYLCHITYKPGSICTTCFISTRTKACHRTRKQPTPLQRLLVLNCRQWSTIKWVWLKKQIEQKLTLFNSTIKSLTFRVFIYKVRVIRGYFALLEWADMKRRIWMIRIRSKRYTNPRSNRSCTVTIANVEFKNHVPHGIATDKFDRAHRAYLKFEMHKLQLLCRHSLQFTYITI